MTKVTGYAVSAETNDGQVHLYLSEMPPRARFTSVTGVRAAVQEASLTPPTVCVFPKGVDPLTTVTLGERVTVWGRRAAEPGVVKYEDCSLDR
jgi:hypothetical protein